MTTGTRSVPWMETTTAMTTETRSGHWMVLRSERPLEGTTEAESV